MMFLCGSCLLIVASQLSFRLRMHRILAEEELALIPEEMCENKRYINYCSNEYSPETIDTDMYSVGWSHYNVTDGLHWKYHAPWWYRPPSYTDTFTLKSMS